MSVSIESCSSVKISEESRGTLRLLTGMSVAYTILNATIYVWQISWGTAIPRDGTLHVIGRDFLNFWMYGRAAWLPDPGRFYDPQTYGDMVSGFLGFQYLGQNWSYPPSLMLVVAPFGWLNYFPALLLWTVLGVGALIWAIRRYSADWRLLVPIFCSPSAQFCLVSGQSAFLTAAMLLTIMACLDRKPVLAGVMIGLLTLKPQIGVLFPFMLAASGRRQAFVVAALTSLAIVAATAIVFGPQVWIDFVAIGLPVQNEVLADPDRVATPFFPTIFMNVRGIGASYGTAMLIQACLALFAIGAIMFVCRYHKHADPRLLNALFFACSVCGVPYLMAYDTLPITCVAVLLLAAGKLDVRGEICAKLTFWLPLIQVDLGQYHIPGPAFITAAFAAALLRQIVGSARAPKVAVDRRRIPPS